MQALHAVTVDEVVKSLQMLNSVIPAQAGIQEF
jgi:hypothetical protein